MNALANLSQADSLPALLGASASPVLQIMLDDRLFERCKTIAKYMAAAEGFVPQHLIGKQEACFAVVCNSIVWKLNPYMVANSTFQLPGGRVGYEGKLVHAIMEASGRVDGAIEAEHYGDWDRIRGKFEIKESSKGNKFASPAWRKEEEAGLGVQISAQIYGEKKPRVFKFDLVQAFPRNSTIWATDPQTQLGYTAMRRFASACAPGLMMGVPFDREDIEPMHYGPDGAKDITPSVGRPQRKAAPAKATTADPVVEADAGSGLDDGGDIGGGADGAAGDQQQDAEGEAGGGQADLWTGYPVVHADGTAEDIDDLDMAVTAICKAGDEALKAGPKAFDTWLQANRAGVVLINDRHKGSEAARRVNRDINLLRQARETPPKKAATEQQTAPSDQGEGEPEPFWFQPLSGLTSSPPNAEAFATRFKQALAQLSATDRDKLIAKNGQGLQRLKGEREDLYDALMAPGAV